MKKIKMVANPLTKVVVGSLTYLDRQIPANPLSKLITGALTYLDKDREKHLDGSATLISTSINNTCNYQCPHCIERDYQRGEEDYELLRNRFEELPDKSVLWFSIAGKEPTTTPKRLEEIAKIAKRKSEKVIVMTNGALLDRNLQKRLSKSVDYLDISLDGIRENTYKNMQTKTWKNALTASKNGFEKVSILTTIMGNNSGKVGEFVKRVGKESDGEIAHSLGFYYGCPKNPELLTEDEITNSIREILTHGGGTTIQIGPAYARFLPRIFKEFGIDPKSKRYDSKTGIPSFDLEGHTLITPTHLENPLDFLRIEVDGNVYFGCSHLMLNGDTSKYTIGNLEKESLLEIREKISSGKSDLVEKVSYIDPICIGSECFEYCRGGDRLNGVIFTGKPVDPYCENLN